LFLSIQYENRHIYFHTELIVIKKSFLYENVKLDGGKEHKGTVMSESVKKGPIPFLEAFGKIGYSYLKLLYDYGYPLEDHLKVCKNLGIKINKRKLKEICKN
jgi:hypothetical protein